MPLCGDHGVSGRIRRIMAGYGPQRQMRGKAQGPKRIRSGSQADYKAPASDGQQAGATPLTKATPTAGDRYPEPATHHTQRGAGGLHSTNGMLAPVEFEHGRRRPGAKSYDQLRRRRYDAKGPDEPREAGRGDQGGGGCAARALGVRCAWVAGVAQCPGPPLQVKGRYRGRCRD